MISAGAIATSIDTDVEQSLFTGNQAPSGGAIAYTFPITTVPAAGSSLTVNQSYFKNNCAPNKLTGNGGAICCSVTADAVNVNVTNTNSTFNANGQVGLPHGW
jgi:hypothetical protein